MYSNFQSQSELNARKEEIKQARKVILEQAKRSYEYAESKKEKARKEGQGTWMLDSVSQRIGKETEEMKKAKKKKRKKDKKKKKKYSSNSSSDSNDDDEDGDKKEWVEAKPKINSLSGPVVKGPQLQRDIWMDAPLDLIPTTSRQDLKDAAKKQKDEARKEAEFKMEPGQHVRELNPYWKDGGSGLPEKDQDKRRDKSLSSSSSPTLFSSSRGGDGGLSWLRKAYDRCKQQAQEECRSLEEIAAERWGSLSKLESMLAEAERNLKEGGKKGSRRDERSESNIGDHRQSRNVFHDWKSSEDKRESSGREGNRRREGSTERDSSRRSSSREMSSGRFSKNGRSIERREHDDRNQDNPRNAERSQKATRFCRPGSDSEDEPSIPRTSIKSFKDISFERHNIKQSEQSNEIRKRHFVKPVDYLDTSEAIDRKCEDDRSSNLNQPRWKKNTTKIIRDDIKEEEMKKNEDKRSSNRRGITKRSRSTSSSGSDSSISRSHSSKSENEFSDNEKQNEGARTSSERLLSEEELNDLAAKILRAEIMGDDATATSLKLQLENARKFRETSKTQSKTTAPDFSHRRRKEKVKDDHRGTGDDEDNIVVLSRTSKGGLVRPVLSSSHDTDTAGGKRRKRNVATHDIKGERTLYFDDDDKFDLKTLVEQEKAGTAEDQNSMFARLAARSSDKDLDVDDMFLSKAARKQNEEQVAARDRSVAIFEHKKLSTAMEKCYRCFEKVPKHLIIAIGTKSYLCLPHHRSLSEGHCLIVPMQHVSAATSMDEDVWLEIQLFRKCLVQMFAAQDQDMVVMETVMNLKHFPHTAIECVPLDREMGDLAPIYFKKAIQDAGPEWADNKKLHGLNNKDVRHVIPKGFPYFSVDFGLQGGYATVIEDEAKFPSYFGREIVGGMLDAEPALWRKPHKQSFEDQRQKVLHFADLWKPYDWTLRI